MNLLKLVKSKEMTFNNVEIFFKYWSANNIPIYEKEELLLPGAPSLNLEWFCPQCKKKLKFSQLKCVTLEDAAHIQYVLPLCDNCICRENDNIAINDDSQRLLVKISE